MMNNIPKTSTNKTLSFHHYTFFICISFFSMLSVISTPSLFFFLLLLLFSLLFFTYYLASFSVLPPLIFHYILFFSIFFLASFFCIFLLYCFYSSNIFALFSITGYNNLFTSFSSISSINLSIFTQSKIFWLKLLIIIASNNWKQYFQEVLL